MGSIIGLMGEIRDMYYKTRIKLKRSVESQVDKGGKWERRGGS